MQNDDVTKLCPAPAERRYSVGHTCGLLQIMPEQLVVIMEAADVRFVAMIDGVPMLDGAGLLAVQDRLEAVRSEIKGKAAAAECN